MINIKNKLLLKKSYEVRKLLDILLHSNNIIFLHLDKFYGESFNRIKQELHANNIKISLINKDRIVVSDLSFVAKGPTLIVYSENFFYTDLINILERNKISFEILLIKVNSYVSTKRVLSLINKYKMSSLVVNNFFFFLMNYYKNLMFFFVYFLKIYYKKLILIFYNRFSLLFLLYSKLLKINNK
jgi:hypothetical protein